MQVWGRCRVATAKNVDRLRVWLSVPKIFTKSGFIINKIQAGLTEVK